MRYRCFAIVAVSLSTSGLIGPGGEVVPRARAQQAPPASVSSPARKKKKIERVEKSDVEWRKLLTRRQFAVTRRKDTERPFSGRYLHNKRHGDYNCVCCGLKLFESGTKYNSGTGWPAFWEPVDMEHIVLAPDFSAYPVRMEVRCAACDAHLGHVFGDGPRPTGARYCINSTALEFVEASKKPAAKSSNDADGKASRVRP